jgi:murein DD-endopeptidase MepM/ murein hydrolase activator NlpD
MARPVVATPAAAGRAPAPMSSVHVVAPGETLVGISRRYNRPIAEIAAANNIAPHTMLKMGDRLIIPGKIRTAGRTASVTPEPQPAALPKVAPPAPAAAPPSPRAVEKPAPAQPQKFAEAEPNATIRAITPSGDPEGDASNRGTTPAFRWPVRGRVIAEFGAKTNGQQNDGINLAVPEGTAVRAAEDGVVAYAGSELKGYGNLVLVRHSNGFVTAYAHASEIMVKRNDPVRRGQVIAKSGQTGNVASPQLHFEIRRGSRPVDPMQHLASGA